ACWRKTCGMVRWERAGHSRRTRTDPPRATAAAFTGLQGRCSRCLIVPGLPHAASAEISTIDFACWPLLPAMVAAEGGEAQEAPADGVEHVLLGATDAGRRRVRLLERPLAGGGVESPGFGILFAATALIVAAPADDPPCCRVIAERRLIAHSRRGRPPR